jgi:S1-C subfamily serine protease
MGIRIHHLTGAAHEQTTFFSSHRITIGRRGGSDIRFDPQADRMVSADHAEIVFLNNSWILRDRGSSNGVWIKGHRVAEVILHGGEEVVFGKDGPALRIEVCDDSESIEGESGIGLKEISHERLPSDGQQGSAPQAPRASFIRNIVQDAVRKGYLRFTIAVAVMIGVLVCILIYLTLELYHTRDDLKRIELAKKGPSEIGEAIARANNEAIYLLIAHKPGGGEEGFCTGFAISKTKLMTNAHCVLQIEKMASEGSVFFAAPNEGKGVRYRLTGWKAHLSYDKKALVPTPDLGMITVDGRLSTVVSIADAEQLRLLGSGSQIFVFGFPGDLSNVRSPVATLTEGVVGRMTALDGTAASSEKRHLLQYSAFTSKGTSGSPVFDKFGRVVAVNSGYYQGRSQVTIENPVTGQSEKTKVFRDLAGYSFGIRVDLSNGID